jgi:valyl-tRNA synthetase
MDTWATSSLTPQVVCGWERDPDLFARTFPMDLRPQAYEIIRTWLFSTMVRAHYEHGMLPWRHAALSGWVLDPDRKKMSKSLGNVIVPMEWIDKYGADGVRYWAACARPGTDTTFDEGQVRIGRKLATKILNVSKFVLSFAPPHAGLPLTGRPPERREMLDRALLGQLAELVDDTTGFFDGFDYARAIERTERFFWSFCDDYVELVKSRAYGGRGDVGRASAIDTLHVALSTLLRLFAPFLPYVTEEVWSWWQRGSIHRAAWPTSAGLRTAAGDADALVYAVASEVLGAVRKAKSEQKRSLATPVTSARVTDTEARLAMFALVEGDVRDAGRIGELVTIADGEFAVDVELAPSDAS